MAGSSHEDRWPAALQGPGSYDRIFPNLQAKGLSAFHAAVHQTDYSSAHHVDGVHVDANPQSSRGRVLLIEP